MAGPRTVITLPTKSALDGIKDYLNKAALMSHRALQHIAKTNDHIRQAEVEAAMHRKSIEQWRETMERTRR